MLIMLVVILVDGIVGGDVGLDRVQAWPLAFKIVFGVMGSFSVFFGGGVVRRLVVVIFFVFAFRLDRYWSHFHRFSWVILFVVHVGKIVSCGLGSVQVNDEPMPSD